MHKLLGIFMVSLFAVSPTSTNYTLKTYDVGGSGGSSSSTNYQVNATAGSQSGTTTNSTNYQTNTGVQSATTATVPPAPTITNPSSYYDKLKLVINNGTDPSDTKYLIAISSDNFVTTNYVQADTSVASSQALANYQTYAAWGGSSGFLIIGLTPSTTYKVKVKALQGNFSGSAFGPTASAATVAPSLTMSLTTSLTASPPFPVTFSSLVPGSVVDGSADAILQLTSNANNGGTAYVASSNAGLHSALANNTITSASANLTSVNEGYGAIVTAASQTSGGPWSSQSPYNGASNNVGALSTSLQPLLTTVGPVVGGSSTIRLKAKASSITPSANDYSDIVTFIIAMNY